MGLLWCFLLPLLVVACAWFPWLSPVALVLAVLANSLERRSPAKKASWITEPVKPLSGIDAEIRRRYEADLLTTEQFVTAMESGKLPDSLRAYSDETRARIKERAARYNNSRVLPVDPWRDRELRRTGIDLPTPSNGIIDHETYRAMRRKLDSALALCDNPFHEEQASQPKAGTQRCRGRRAPGSSWWHA